MVLNNLRFGQGFGRKGQMRTGGGAVLHFGHGYGNLSRTARRRHHATYIGNISCQIIRRLCGLLLYLELNLRAFIDVVIQTVSHNELAKNQGHGVLEGF